MCFSLCFRVGFSCSFFASSFVFVVTLNHVREGCSFGVIVIVDLFWLVEFGLSMLVWFSCGHLVIGHRDYSLTLIVCDSRRSSVIGLIGNQGIGCDLWSRWVSDCWLSWVELLLAILGLGWVGVWLSCGCIAMSWLWGWMVGGDLFLID